MLKDLTFTVKLIVPSPHPHPQHTHQAMVLISWDSHSRLLVTGDKWLWTLAAPGTENGMDQLLEVT